MLIKKFRDQQIVHVNIVKILNFLEQAKWLIVSLKKIWMLVNHILQLDVGKSWYFLEPTKTDDPNPTDFRPMAVPTIWSRTKLLHANTAQKARAVNSIIYHVEAAQLVKV